MLQSDKPNDREIKAQKISMPSGGGSIRGVGESFQTNMFSGTESFSIPVPVTSARGCEPALSLDYNSGDGNSEFGLGFSVPLGKISRRTDTGIPDYTAQDRFVISGEGQLTPRLVKRDGQWIEDVKQRIVAGVTYNVLAYLPRKESSYALVEQFTQASNGKIWWQLTSNDNVVTVFGKNSNSKVSDPHDSLKIFEWLIESSTDAKGNTIAYRYKVEDGENLDKKIYDSNRSLSGQKYIQSIQYGNYFDGEEEPEQIYAFELIFDYGEYSLSDLNQANSDPYKPVKAWPERSDPFSSYRSGFEIRTLRLCRNILLFHHFPELGQTPCLVSALRLDGTETPIFSFINEITRTGYRINSDGSYTSQDSPALALEYSQFLPSDTPKFSPLVIDGVDGVQSIPGYLDNSGFVPVSLNSESLPGLFYSNSQTAMYYEPMGEGRYQLPKLVAPLPITHNLKNPALTLKSLEGNGQLSLVVDSASQSGYYDQRYDGSWSNFKSFKSLPTELMNSAGENVDLEGNGKTGWALFQQPQVSYYPSAGKVGYREAECMTLPKEFPGAVNYGELELVTFANIFGDGLSHRVRVRDGSVDVWPCLGSGKFGDKVSLSKAPRFSNSTKASRIYFADVDGAGTADLIFVYSDRVEVYLNQSGNSFATEALKIYLPGGYSDKDKIQFIDVLGAGTAALVLTKAGPKMRHLYYNFCGERRGSESIRQEEIRALKPYLLTKTDNNLGAVNEIFYASSTQFFLRDKQAGKPWVTKLPFPVQVVEKTISIDLISGSRASQVYAYHEGYYDFTEKSFRGFGFIESWDTETFSEYNRNMGRSGSSYDKLDKSLYVPPKYTKTWHHVGAFFEKGLVSKQYQSMYYHGDVDAYDFPDSILSESVLNSDAQTIRQAYAALQGTLMRQEVYALDDGPLQENPYTVSQANVEVSLVQPKAHQRYAVFTVNPRERIAYNYERVADDPRVTQEFTLEVDRLSGKPVKECTVLLPRRNGHAEVQPEQQVISASASYKNYINSKNDEPYRYRGVALQEQEFEILGLALDGQSYFSYSDIEPVATAVETPIPYQSQSINGEIQASQLGWQKNFYWNEEQTKSLPFGKISCRLLQHHSEAAVFPESFVSEVFGDQLTDETLHSEGGYVFDKLNGYWWNKGLTQFYGDLPESFYLPHQTENTFIESGSHLFTKSSVEYDQPYCFSIVKTTQYLGDPEDNKNIVTASIDYITQKPFQEVDINDNVSQVIFDPLGQVIVSSTFGIENDESVGGMRLYPYGGQPVEYIQHDDASFNNVLHDSKKYLQGAAHYFYYNLLAWKNQQPACSIDLLRTDFYHHKGATSKFACKTSIEYSDGFARELESKVKAEPGLTFVRGKSGNLVLDKENRPSQTFADERWMVSGRTVYNNKAKPCELYLEYFSNTPEYESQKDIIEQKLVPPPTVTHYDALGRVIRVDTPKGFFTKTEISSWKKKHFDEDDTVIHSSYYKEFMDNYPSNPNQKQKDEKDALDKAAKFFNTPEIQVLDNLGNAFQKIQILADQKRLTSFSKSDIQGRTILTIDPRLYSSNIEKGTKLYNFLYRFAMDADKPVLVVSCDAGKSKHLNNIYNNQFWALSARNYCQLTKYDGLQRQAELRVKHLENALPITSYSDFNLVEVFSYGESRPNAANNNLRGQLFELKDLSGIAINNEFNVQGKLLNTSRQIAEDYKSAVNWDSSPQPLVGPKHLTSYSYNALDQIVTEIAPDGSKIQNRYNQAGFLDELTATFETKEPEQIIKHIEYDAKGQRTNIEYGNGIYSQYLYEESTLRLIGLKSNRLGLPADTVQDITYTYDPVGNITRSYNDSFKTVFCDNQKVDPLSDYTYDALYRLIQASGRQHIGITANTYKNNHSENNFKQCIFSKLPDLNNAEKLENYQINYSYDDSGNLVDKFHQAASSTWRRELPVHKDSNWLEGVEYDAGGNMRQLDINNNVDLAFNCCDNLVRAGIIERPDELDDCDYYVYDSGEQRTRKVSERLSNGGRVTIIEDKIYLGNFEIRREITVDEQGNEKVNSEQKSLRLFDGGSCLLISNYCSIGEYSGTRKNRYQLSNLLGSVSSEWSGEAKLISYEEYFPYGGTAIIAGSNQKEVKQKVYRYTGKERDDSTGLYYFGARYYPPWLGRWLSPDPAGTVDGMNLYTFVKGNPITFVDPNGLALTAPLDRTAAPALGAPHPVYAGAAPAVHFGMNGFGAGPENENNTGYYGYRDQFVTAGTGIMAETSWRHIFRGARFGPMRTAGRAPRSLIQASLATMVGGLAAGAAYGSRWGWGGAILGAIGGTVAGIAISGYAGTRYLSNRINHAAANAPMMGAATLGRVVHGLGGPNEDYTNRTMAPADRDLYRHVISAFSGNKNVVSLATAKNVDVPRLGIRYSKAAIDYVFSTPGASVHFHLDGLVLNGPGGVDFDPVRKGSNVASPGGGNVEDTVTAHELRYLARRYHRNNAANPNVTFYLNGAPLAAQPAVPNHVALGSRL